MQKRLFSRGVQSLGLQMARVVSPISMYTYLGHIYIHTHRHVFMYLGPKVRLIILGGLLNKSGPLFGCPYSWDRCIFGCMMGPLMYGNPHMLGALRNDG